MLVTASLFGLLGSFHCVGMCGPIAFMLPVDRSNATRRVIQIFLYHLGRVIAYAIIGLLFGLVGKGLYLFGFQQKLSIIIGGVMILTVFLSTRLSASSWVTKLLYKGISKVKNSLGVQLKKQRADTFFTIGFLNGFLPCGLVYMAVFGSIASGDAISGSLYMALFGMGTIPLMTTAIYLGNFLKGKTRKYIRKSIPVFVVLIGLLFIVRGMGLGIPYLSPKPVQDIVSNNSDCHTSYSGNSKTSTLTSIKNNNENN